MAFVSPKSAPAGLWRRTPPAIFPPVLGLLALALGWRRGAAVFDLPAAPADLLAGGVTLFCLFCMVAYTTKLIRRPGVVLEDLRILPGRAGLSAAVLCLYLGAMLLDRFAPGAALWGLGFGMAMHLALTAAMLFCFATGPAEQRRVTPAWHLLFSGWVVAALAADQLGLTTLAAGLFWLALAAAMGIWTVSLQQFSRQSVPAPLRPFLAIHLAPAALLGTLAAAMGAEAMAQVFAALAALALAGFVIRAPWFLAAGFSPLWGALTFPLAATANLWLALGGPWRIAGAAALVAASLIVPAIALRIIKMWRKGELAPKTAAATA